MDELAKRNELAEAVQGAPNMTAAEKQTGITFLGTDEEMTISTYKSTMVRSLLEHAEARVKRIYLYHGDEGIVRCETNVDIVYDTVSDDDGTYPVGIDVEIPIGCLTIKGSPRTKDHQSQIVNTPADIEAMEGAFSEADA